MAKPPKNPFDQFMEEAEELLAPFKLIVRIIRRPRPTTAMSSESVSILRKFLGWDGFSFVFFTGLAFAFLQLPYQYDKARWCFIAAAMALVIKIVHSVNVVLYPKLLIAILGATLAGLAVNRINDWVSKLEIDALAHALPEIRVVVGPKPALSPPPRSFLVFDGPMRFGEKRDDKGQLVSDQNLQVGDRLAFDYYFKATGPNPVTTIGAAYWLYVEPDFSPETQKLMIADFKARLKKEQKQHVVKAVPFTLMPEDKDSWNTVYAQADKKFRLVTQPDLAALRIGQEIVFVMVEIPYLDSSKVHHLRTCQFLQPPATFPGIWHFCQGFTNPD